MYNDLEGTFLTHSGSHKSYKPLCVLTFRVNYYLHQLEVSIVPIISGTTQAITIQATVKYPLFYRREKSRQNGNTNQARPTSLQNSKLFFFTIQATNKATNDEIGFCISHLLCTLK